MKTGSGESESHGLSLLDVVKHAVKTIAKVCECLTLNFAPNFECESLLNFCNVTFRLNRFYLHSNSSILLHGTLLSSFILSITKVRYLGADNLVVSVFGNTVALQSVLVGG